jgi:hypothetical protein
MLLPHAIAERNITQLYRDMGEVAKKMRLCFTNKELAIDSVLELLHYKAKYALLVFIDIHNHTYHEDKQKCN